ncbi:MAG: glycosyltransferase family 2 protein [Vulcanimicrobiaceae bacterium]
MLYSIIVPSLDDRHALHGLLRSLDATLTNPSDGETVVVESGTPAAAFNEGARRANGRFLVFLMPNVQLSRGWLDSLLSACADSTVGAAGPLGYVARPSAIGPAAFAFVDDARVTGRREAQAVSCDCLITSRSSFDVVGGFDETYRGASAGIDYCLRLRERDLKVVYDPGASVMRAAAAPQVFSEDIARLAECWRGRVALDFNDAAIERGEIVREATYFSRKPPIWLAAPIASVTVAVVGRSTRSKAELEAAIRANRAPVGRIVWCEAADQVACVREVMEQRGDRYLAIVRADELAEPGWLDDALKELAADMRRGAVIRSACTLLWLKKFPAHHRLADVPSLGEALCEYLATALREFSVTTRSQSAPFAQSTAQTEQSIRGRARREPGLVSIVTLSWNAPQFTKLAIESIRAHTRHPYEIIVVDNGSGEETTSWLRGLEDVRVIFNPENRGFAVGNNQGFAAARGEYVVMLNNDVIVTEGWLEGLLGAFARIPGLGVSAPRSNRVAGHQQLGDCTYQDIPSMHAYAGARRERFRDSGYLAERAIGLCLCIDRRVLDEVGGIDPRYGIGNFEDDDFCMRVRAAGYKIYICDDVFIHHFGSQTFAANKVDWAATMQANWRKFADKWGYAEKELKGSYDPTHAIAGGFDRARHYVPLPEPEPANETPVAGEPKAYRMIFAASVGDDADWNDVGALVKRYVRAFDASSGTLLSIAAHGTLPAQTIGERVNRVIEKLNMIPDAAPDIDVTDEDDVHQWLATLAGVPVRGAGGKAVEAENTLEPLRDRSPSGLQRALAGTERASA